MNDLSTIINTSKTYKNEEQLDALSPAELKSYKAEVASDRKEFEKKKKDYIKDVTSRLSDEIDLHYVEYLNLLEQVEDTCIDIMDARLLAQKKELIKKHNKTMKDTIQEYALDEELYDDVKLSITQFKTLPLSKLKSSILKMQHKLDDAIIVIEGEEAVVENAIEATPETISTQITPDEFQIVVTIDTTSETSSKLVAALRKLLVKEKYEIKMRK